MARKTRQTFKLFGDGGGTSNFGQFGSGVTTPVTSKNIATIQALTAWANGWQDAVALDEAPYLQDTNAKDYVFAYEIFYMLQEGVAEWDSGTTYFSGSLVKFLGNSGYVEFYLSLIDNNTGNAPPTRATNGNWQFMYAQTTVSGLIVPGSSNGSNMPTGAVGEAVRGYASAVNAAASGVWGDITTISLTAGDWDISGGAIYSANGATISQGNLVALSAFSGATATDHLSGDNQIGIGVSTASVALGTQIASWRQSFNSTTTFYLKGFTSYVGGPPQWYGRISARRVA